MAVKKLDRFFKEVAANTTLTDEYTPLEDEVLSIGEAYGQAGMSPDTVVAITWDEGGGDEEIVFCTHASGVDNHTEFEVTADGVKKLTMKLINNQGTADMLGVGWQA